MKNITQHGSETARELYSQIDSLPEKDREFEKILTLRKHDDFLNFMCTTTGVSLKKVTGFLDDLYSDDVFKIEFHENLSRLQHLGDLGDLRFHSVSLYLLARSTEPELALEAGVAHGKSSAYLLLALEHNGTGQLFSVDLPATGKRTEDGSATKLSGFSPGWLVPNRLRKRWTLHQEDSVEFLAHRLPILMENPGVPKEVSLFFHDSLHTYTHVEAELQLIAPLLGERYCIAVDNIDMPGGAAFDDFLHRMSLFGHSFTDFGTVVVQHP